MPHNYTQAEARMYTFVMMAGVFGLLWGFFGFLGGMALGPAALLFLGGAGVLAYGIVKTSRPGHRG